MNNLRIVVYSILNYFMDFLHIVKHFQRKETIKLNNNVFLLT